MDINGDGRADLIGGAAHDRGLFWFEQRAVGESWIPHVIDNSYTQLHGVIAADINGDGVNDIVAGKTLYAHYGLLDPDEFGPAVLYWYEIVTDPEGGPRFVRHFISDTGTGRQVSAGDVDGDGLMDLVLGNRKGVFLLLQRVMDDQGRCG